VSIRNRICVIAAICGLLAGCNKVKVDETTHVSLTPTVKTSPAGLRDIRRAVAQPGEIEPYEQTAIYSKVSGFVQKWNVDIGDRVTKDQLLAELLIPELADEHRQKIAEVEQEQAMVTQSEKLVAVAQRDLEAAGATVAEAQAGIDRYEADVERWQGELDRLNGLVKDQVVNPEILAETQKQLKSSESAAKAAQAGVKTKESQRLAAEAQLEKAKADLNAAQARVKVAEAEEQRLAVMFGYTRITAPYDGVITARNINSGDFVRSGTGDSSDSHEGEASGAKPLFVVTRTDPMLFVIGVPEVDAPYVSAGSKAVLRVQALAGREFDCQVTRIAPALRRESRTLTAEIDLPNKDGKLLPGMYAYGSIQIDRPQVRAVPSSATVQIGNRTCCYLVSDGKAIRTQLQTGVSDGTWVEVVKRANYPINGETGSWRDFDGSERVIVGDLSELTDGEQVAVDSNEVSAKLSRVAGNDTTNGS
jgi:RND family efflux transporter MFP subunit